MSSVVRVAKAGIKPPKAPLGAFVFAGPTGVGKTQTAQTLADTLGMKMLRIDMSEYKTREDLSRLIGAPPGFVGYDEGEGYLFEHMKKYPKTVIVFDEIDKASPDVMNILLQVMEDGRLTSNRGDTVKFNESVIILTTNLGMKDMVIEGGRPHPVSLYPEMEEAVKSGDPEKIKAFVEKMNTSVIKAVKRFFRPEFLNRLDGVLVFNPLPLDSLTKIVELFLSETIDRFKDRQGINLVVGRSDEERHAINKILAEKGYIAEYGARPMAEAVKRHFENPLSAYRTQNMASIRRDDTITAKLEKGKIVFEHKKSEEEQKVEELNEQDRTAIKGIADRFQERPDEAITIGDLEEIFGLRKEVEIGAGKMIDAAKLTDSYVLTGPDFRKKDKEANKGRKAIVAKVPDEKKKALDSWIKETVRVTKRANFESFLYEKDRMVIKDYWEALPEILSGRIKEAQEAGKLVRLAAGQSDGSLRIAIGYNSGFSKFLQRHIFATEYENAEEIEKTAPRALQGFLKAKLELESTGIETNFYQEEGMTWFWVEIPVEKAEAPEEAAPKTESAERPTGAQPPISDKEYLDLYTYLAEIDRKLAKWDRAKAETEPTETIKDAIEQAEGIYALRFISDRKAVEDRLIKFFDSLPPNLLNTRAAITACGVIYDLKITGEAESKARAFLAGTWAGMPEGFFE
ncbi:MAG: AAA family ATPase, partial [Candidatus Omnitrophota bacterium]